MGGLSLWGCRSLAGKCWLSIISRGDKLMRKMVIVVSLPSKLLNRGYILGNQLLANKLNLLTLILLKIRIDSFKLFNNSTLMLLLILLNKELLLIRWSLYKQLTILLLIILKVLRIFWWLQWNIIRGVILCILAQWECMDMELFRVSIFQRDIAWLNSIALIHRSVCVNP